MTRRTDRPIRVCMAGTWDPHFGRNRILRRLLERAGFEVTICRVDLWGERSGAVVRRRKLAVLLRALVAYPLLVGRFLRIPKPDIVLVPYPGHFDMPVLWVLSRIRRAPVIFDAFISLFDTVVSDRRLASRRSFVGRLARTMDRAACRLADLNLADTPPHARYLSTLSRTPLERFRVLWVGAQEGVFQPRPGSTPDPDLVLFYGTFIPLQGVETIVRAAKRLEPDGIRVRIIGDGQERHAVDRLASELEPTNLERIGLVPLERLPQEIAAAGVCLGIFGTTEKADRVVPNKLYEGLAVGRPVVTGDTTAVRSAFEGGEVVTVPVGDAEALADAVRRLCRDAGWRERVAAAGHARFRRDYSEKALSALLVEHLEGLVRDPPPGERAR